MTKIRNKKGRGGLRREIYLCREKGESGRERGRERERESDRMRMKERKRWERKREGEREIMRKSEQDQK